MPPVYLPVFHLDGHPMPLALVEELDRNAHSYFDVGKSKEGDFVESVHLGHRVYLLGPQQCW